MSKPDWASFKSKSVLAQIVGVVKQRLDTIALTCIQYFIARALRSEHRRGVRVVAQVKAKMHENIVANREWVGCKLDRCYLQACDDILAALRKVPHG